MSQYRQHIYCPFAHVKTFCNHNTFKDRDINITLPRPPLPRVNTKQLSSMSTLIYSKEEAFISQGAMEIRAEEHSAWCK